MASGVDHDRAVDGGRQPGREGGLAAGAAPVDGHGGQCGEAVAYIGKRDDAPAVGRVRFDAFHRRHDRPPFCALTPIVTAA